MTALLIGAALGAILIVGFLRLVRQKPRLSPQETASSPEAKEQ